MKPIYEHSVGGDGAIAGLYIDEEGGFIVEQVKYPLNKALEPADKFIDSSIDGLEAKLGWAKPVLEGLRAAAHAALKKLVSAVVPG